MKKLPVTVISFLFLANILFAQTTEDLLIDEIVSQVDTEELRLIVEQLSGERPLDDGSLIITRQVGTDGKEKAAQYIAEHYSNIENLRVRKEGFNPVFIGGLGSFIFNVIAAPERDTKGHVVGFISAITDITERKKAEQKLINYQNQRKALASQLTLSEEKERKRLADSLHDEIGQQLCGITIKLAMLKDSLSSTEDAKTLGNVLSAVQQVVDHTRSLTTELSPPILYELGFEKALEWLAEQTHNYYGIMVTCEDDKRDKPLEDDVKIFLYQAVRELLANGAKHPQVKNATVT